MEKFNRNEIKLTSKKDGTTGKTIHNVMVKIDNKFVCHSSFYKLHEASDFMKSITK